MQDWIIALSFPLFAFSGCLVKAGLLGLSNTKVAQK